MSDNYVTCKNTVHGIIGYKMRHVAPKGQSQLQELHSRENYTKRTK